VSGKQETNIPLEIIGRKPEGNVTSVLKETGVKEIGLIQLVRDGLHRRNLVNTQANLWGPLTRQIHEQPSGYRLVEKGCD
jgi:hypothetical protein